LPANLAHCHHPPLQPSDHPISTCLLHRCPRLNLSLSMKVHPYPRCKMVVVILLLYLHLHNNDNNNNIRQCPCRESDCRSLLHPLFHSPHPPLTSKMMKSLLPLPCRLSVTRQGKVLEQATLCHPWDKCRVRCRHSVHPHCGGGDEITIPSHSSCYLTSIHTHHKSALSLCIVPGGFFLTMDFVHCYTHTILRMQLSS